MSAPDVISRSEQGICHIQINRPQFKNATNQAAYSALSEALQQAEADNSVKVIVLSGSEGNFTSGNDIKDFLAKPSTGKDSPIAKFMHSLHRCEKPVIAAVEGVAVGLGTTLLLHCDLIYAAPNSRFLLPFNGLGVNAEFGSSYLLPRLVGRAKAMELILLGDIFGADTALEIGLINAVEEQPIKKALEVAARLSKQPPQATRINKRALRADHYQRVDQLIDEELELLKGLLQGPELAEAAAAFMEKRQPDFSKC